MSGPLAPTARDARRPAIPVKTQRRRGAGLGGTAVAHEVAVVVCTVGAPRDRATRKPLAAQRRARGFSLLELMVVVIVIGLLAVLAVPTLSVARFDRLAYDDAGSVMQLLRSARMHAIARGGAVLVTMQAGGGNRGTFSMFEAVTNNPGGLGLPRTPVSSCKTPTVWSPLPLPGGAANPGVLYLDGVNLNGTGEAQADVEAQISIYGGPNNPAPTAQTFPVNVCWTPLGHSYVFVGAPAAGMFDGQTPTVSPIAIDVQRAVQSGGGATIRSILLPPNGMARLFSHAVVAQP